ncbi:MAG: helix-turn-helix transcriptional regulator [Brachymonas sp.]|nr:helix-turn-helix transcriptional regulator [Brachymonas sp.]
MSSAAISAEIGARLKQLRLARNISQQQLAQMTQGSLSSVRRLEAAGQGTLDFVVRVAQALQVVDQLNSWFVLPATSIAEAERLQGVSLRQRARVQRKAAAKP